MLCSRVGRETPFNEHETQNQKRYDCNLNEGPVPLDAGAQRHERKMFNLHWSLLSFSPDCEKISIMFKEFFHKSFVTKLRVGRNNVIPGKSTTKEAFETFRISLTALEQSFWALLQVQRIFDWSLWLLTSSSDFRKKFARLQKFSEFIDTSKVDNSMRQNCCKFCNTLLVSSRGLSTL